MSFSLGNYKFAFYEIPLETGKEENGIIIAVVIIVVVLIIIIAIIIITIITIKHVAMPPIRLALEGREI